MKNFKSLKITFPLMLAFTVMSFFGANVAQAQQAKLITVKSVKSFAMTVEGIKKGVADAGMMVLAEINHGKILSMTGLSINAESIFIGNPTVGKDAFSENTAVGLAIPLRVNVYEEKGVTYINYFTPSSELGYFKGNKVKMIGQKLDEKIAMLTGMFAK
ncbi:MAG: DUF302 domain-containing protein [Bacteroidota bacterium]|nr:DUF302 domain-containing protein [Bacteroidota bacterium]